jgi:nucleotidyltransferase/DNA polymerase involved in DNA repair
MVGTATEKVLKAHGINTIKDLALSDHELLQDLLGSR